LRGPARFLESNEEPNAVSNASGFARKACRGGLKIYTAWIMEKG